MDTGWEQLEFREEAQMIRRDHRVGKADYTPSVAVVQAAEDSDRFQMWRWVVNVVDDSLESDELNGKLANCYLEIIGIIGKGHQLGQVARFEIERMSQERVVVWTHLNYKLTGF